MGIWSNSCCDTSGTSRCTGQNSPALCHAGYGACLPGIRHVQSESDQCTFGNKRYMHLWLQKIWTSGSRKNAPLTPKDLNLWQQKICVSTSTRDALMDPRYMRSCNPETCTYFNKRYYPLAPKMICTACSKRYDPLAPIDMHLWLKKICTSGFKRYATQATKVKHLWLQKSYASLASKKNNTPLAPKRFFLLKKICTCGSQEMHLWLQKI